MQEYFSVLAEKNVVMEDTSFAFHVKDTMLKAEDQRLSISNKETMESSLGFIFIN